MRKTLKQELAEVKEELARCKDNYLRALAEYDNYSKRVRKEKEEFQKFANERLLIKFTSLLDDFERGLNFLKEKNSNLKDSSEFKEFVEGVELICKKFKSLLEEEGVESFSGLNEEFNPQLHEAVGIEQTDEYLPNYIISELSKGYKLKDKVIRPAKVVVSAKREVSSNQ